MGPRGQCKSWGLYFFYGKGNENLLEKGILYTKEECQQLIKRVSLLMIGCNI